MTEAEKDEKLMNELAAGSVEDKIDRLLTIAEVLSCTSKHIKVIAKSLLTEREKDHE